MLPRKVGVLCAACFLTLPSLSSCGQTVPIGTDELLSAGASSQGGTNGGAAGGGAGGTLNLSGDGPSTAGGGAASGGDAPCQPVECRGKRYECGDCQDNDGDGEVDAFDSACLGPCDDDETGLSTGLSNSPAACRQDCYFDGDAGPGNDKCTWSHQCDPLSVAPTYPPSGEMRCAYDPAPNGLDCQQLSQQQPAACLENCLPVVPNGCDCFGCCELPARSGEYHYIGAGRGAASCVLGSLNDPAACPPCTPVDSCLNDCQACEVCVGGEPDPSCPSGGGECEDGQPSCGRGVPCAIGYYCVTGCCVLSPVR